MVYAGDQWVQLPVRDLYDTQMMAIAINAAKDMYEKGEKRLDDFYTKYGDFTSPIQKDMDAYNNIIGGVRDKINQLYAAGIDPLRSAEGRAAVAQLTRSIPVGDIAKLRQSAETAKEFVKNRGLLERAGKYNKDLNERYLGYNLDTFDTLGGGNVWGISSPMEIESLKELTEKSFNNRTPHDLTKDEVLSFEGQTYDPRMKYKGFTMRDLQNIANTVAPGLYGDPRYDYYRDLARRKVVASGKEPTDKAINEQLSNDIANSQVEYLVRPVGDLDDWYKEQQLNLQKARLSLARQVAGAKLNPQNDAPTTFMDRLQKNMQENFINKVFGSRGATSGQQIANFAVDIANYWDKMAKSVEDKGKIVGYRDEQSSKKISLPSFGVTGFGDFHVNKANSGVAIETKKVPIYDQSSNGYHKKYTRERDRWIEFAKTGKYAPSIYDKSDEAKIVRKILKKNPKTVSAQEQAYVWQYAQNEMFSMQNRLASNSPAYLGKGNQPKGTTTTADLKRRSSAYWDLFRAESLGDIPNTVLTNNFVGTSQQKKDPDLPNNNLKVTFGSGYEYAPIRQSKIAGSGRFKYNDIHSRFGRWLKANGNSGIVTDPNRVIAAGIPNKNRTGIQLDIMQYPSITKEQFMDFYNRSGGYRFGTPEQVAKKLGLEVHNEKLTYKDKDDTLHETDTYYNVPVIRTIDNLGGYIFRDMNFESDKLEFGAKTADENIINSENQSVLQGLLLDDAMPL